MSALVTYDSSSDDDGSPRVALPSTAQESTVLPTGPSEAMPPETQTVADDRVKEQLRDTPVMGPSIPSNMTPIDSSYDNEDPGESLPSERDMIRHLTSATHPMTEMPPSPPGSPDSTTTNKLKKFLDLKAKGVHFNEDLARKATFKNPSLLATMTLRAGVKGDSQYLNSLPTTVFDPNSFPAHAYKEALLKSQQSIRAQEDAEKKALSTAGKRTIEFASAGTSGTSSRNSTPGLQQKRRRP